MPVLPAPLACSRHRSVGLQSNWSADPGITLWLPGGVRVRGSRHQARLGGLALPDACDAISVSPSVS